LPTKVLRVLHGESITPKELADMIRLSARSSLRAGFNRRYFHWLFKIQGDRLEDMQYADIVTVGTGTTQMSEDHEPCDGAGCRACGWTGQIIRRITDKSLPRHEPIQGRAQRKRGAADAERSQNGGQFGER
jgi:hypothetical protein